MRKLIADQLNACEKGLLENNLFQYKAGFI